MTDRFLLSGTSGGKSGLLMSNGQLVSGANVVHADHQVQPTGWAFSGVGTGTHSNGFFEIVGNYDFTTSPSSESAQFVSQPLSLPSGCLRRLDFEYKYDGTFPMRSQSSAGVVAGLWSPIDRRGSTFRTTGWIPHTRIFRKNDRLNLDGTSTGTVFIGSTNVNGTCQFRNVRLSTVAPILSGIQSSQDNSYLALGNGEVMQCGRWGLL